MELFVLFSISISKIRLSSKCRGVTVKSWNKILNVVNKNHEHEHSVRMHNAFFPFVNSFTP